VIALPLAEIINLDEGRSILFVSRDDRIPPYRSSAFQNPGVPPPGFLFSTNRTVAYR